MAGQYYAPDSSDLQVIYVDDYALIDQQANTGSLWGFGRNLSGQLGLNDRTDRISPVQVTMGGVANTNWKQVSAGYIHTAAIKTDGRLWTWGQNNYGQLGDNTVVGKSSPIQTIVGGTNWNTVNARVGCTAAIKTDGTLWLWGRNDTGQLGLNDRTFRSSPVQVTMGGVANTNWKTVSTGSHTGAIKTDGTLWSWGLNAWGELGINSTANTSTPVQVTGGGTNWKQVSGGSNHTAAIKTDRTLWSWGYNYYGQLGINSTANTSTPVQVTGGGTNWKQVSGGWNHTAAIKTDGTLWSWGYNQYGQLGLNDRTPRSTPIQVTGGGTNWKQVSGGRFHTAAIKTDGTLWTWGRNNYGQLGSNTSITTSYSSPVQTISGGTNWKQVNCGDHHTEAIYFYDAGNLYPSA